MEPRSPTIFLLLDNAEARLGSALDGVRWLAGGRRGSAGTVVPAGEVTGGDVLLPRFLVGGTGLVDASA